MARQGRAGPALMISAVGSFIGGTVSVLGLMFIAPPLARVMIAIGPSGVVVLMLVAEIRSRVSLGDTPDLRSLKEIAYGTAPITPTSLTAAIDAG